MPRLPDDSVANPPPIITLLTDFGASDVFVGSMKGVILGINPLAQIVDLTHDIPAHNVRVAAYLLHSAARYFRQGRFLSPWLAPESVANAGPCSRLPWRNTLSRPTMDPS